MEDITEETFYGLDFGARMDYYAKKIMLTGMQRPWWVLFWHFLVWLINYGVFAIVVLLLPKPEMMSGREHARLIFAKLMVWQHLAEAIGCRQGPLGGRLGLPNNWRYRISLNTLKVPVLPFLGKKRNVADLCVNILFFVACVGFLSGQTYKFNFIRLLCACDVFIFLSDMSQFYASTGHAYFTMLLSLCFPTSSGQIAGVQVALIYEWFFSGVGKIGPWFTYVNGPFMLQSRLLRGQRWLFNLLFNSEDDLSPTKLGKVVAHTAGFVEYGAPLFLMVPNYYVIWAGLIGITAMHVYILTMPAPFDVYSWNTCFMCAGVYLFYINATDASMDTWSQQLDGSFGFDWQGLQVMNPILLFVLIAECLLCWYGQFYPNQIGYYLSHRYWAGNWVQGLYMIKKSESARDKLAAVKTFEANPLIEPPPSYKYLISTMTMSALSYLWVATFNMKSIVHLVEEAMRLCGNTNYDDWQFVYSLPSYCCGEFRDQLYSQDLIPTMQQEIGFDEHECFMIALGSFGCGRQSAFWKIIDMKKGPQAPLAEGQLTRHQLTQMHSFPSQSRQAKLWQTTSHDTMKEKLLRNDMGA